MHRKFITFVTITALAITALGNTPAFAGDRDGARALAAILGVAAIGAILHEKNKKKKRKQVHHYQPKPSVTPPRYQPTPPRPLPSRVNRKLLPQECFRSYDTHRGKVRMFGNRCLQRNFGFADRLPRHCLYVFDTPKGDRRGYEARCLRNQGYRLAHK